MLRPGPREAPRKHGIVAFRGSFHGRLFASLAATDRVVSREGTAAVIVEPVQGEGGVRPGLVHGLLREAASLEIEAVFAMTLEVEFYRRLGFRPVPRERLPEKVAADCRSCARREGCRETAVLRRTGRGRRGSGGPAPNGRGSRRKLRVLTS